jgi:hypothetical protein
MAKSQFGVRMSQVMARVAEDRRCPRCQRGSALVALRGDGPTVVICRWVREGKCDDPGAVLS